MQKLRKKIANRLLSLYFARVYEGNSRDLEVRWSDGRDDKVQPLEEFFEESKRNLDTFNLGASVHKYFYFLYISTFST